MTEQEGGYRERARLTLHAVMDYREIDAIELARRLGVNEETPRRWLRGNTVPSAEMVGRLAIALDAPPAILLYPPATRGAVMAAMVEYDDLRSQLRESGPAH